MNINQLKPRKIIHIDMDCFYAAIEIRDNPALANKPVAVGAPPNQRGVLCTANYAARKFGVHSAMSTAQALRQCPPLIVLPVNMPKYKAVAKRIHAIFHDFTLLVEPLSLDEAYLDVTESTHCHGSATLIAQKIRECIWQSEKLTASAGVAPNKFLAKIASGWKKPNGLFVILPQEIDAFIYDLPITELFGVGKVTAQKLHQLGFKTCADLQKFSLNELMHQFGKLGQRLYYYCRGIDDRAVEPNRAAKSLSVEQTFAQDIQNPADCQPILQSLFQKLQQRIQTHAPERQIKNLYIKIKFHDFKSMTAEIAQNQLLLTEYLNLFHTCYARTQKPVRLIGLGVHFQDKPALVATQQGNLF